MNTAMHRTKTYTSKFSSQQLFDLVLNVEQYPQFLPWCYKAAILNREDGYFIAELGVQFSFFKERYVSKVTHIQLVDALEIFVDLIEGPFKRLNSKWLFKENASGGTDVQFDIEFEFTSKTLQALIGGIFDTAMSKMIDAFEKRASEVYSVG